MVNTSPGIIPGLEPYIEAGRAAAYLSISRKTVLKRPARATCRRTLIGSICYQNATKNPSSGDRAAPWAGSPTDCDTRRYPCPRRSCP